MRTVLYFLSLLLIHSCSAQPSEKAPTIEVGGKSYVRVETEKIQDSVHIYSSYWPLLLSHEFFTDEYKIASDSSFILTFDISVPSKHNIHLGKKFSVPVFLVPSDTLTIQVNYQSGQNAPEVTFTGAFANISQYLHEKPDSIAFSIEGAQIFNDPFRLETPEKTLALYQYITDSIVARQQTYLQSNIKKNNLPSWFVEHEKMESILFASYHQLMVPIYWKKFYQVDMAVPKDYINKISTIDINNPRALYSVFFFLYAGKLIRDLLHTEKQEQLLLDSLGVESLEEIKGTEAFENYATQQFYDVAKKADELLEEKILHPFLTHYFFMVSDHQSRIINDNCLDYLNEKLKGTAYLPFIEENYKRSIHLLTAGSKAPEFYLLSDQQDQFLSLADFKGQVVLLNFWFPGCKPCVAEIPHEKELMEKYGEKGFTIVNICFMATPEQWQKAVTKFRLAGVNVVTQGNWERMLTETYGVGSFPHYVLIDKEGKVIENNTHRPSDPRLAQLIENYLNH